MTYDQLEIYPVVSVNTVHNDLRLIDDPVPVPLTHCCRVPGRRQDAGPGVREGPRQQAGDQAPQRPPHDQVDAVEGTSFRPMLLLLT